MGLWHVGLSGGQYLISINYAIADYWLWIGFTVEKMAAFRRGRDETRNDRGTNDTDFPLQISHSGAFRPSPVSQRHVEPTRLVA